MKSINGKLGIVTGTEFMYAVQMLTQTEAAALMQIENWTSTEEV